MTGFCTRWRIDLKLVKELETLINYVFCLIKLIFAFHVEISRLICTANQMTGFFMKRKIELKLVKGFETLIK